MEGLGLACFPTNAMLTQPHCLSGQVLILWQISGNYEKGAVSSNLIVLLTVSCQLVFVEERDPN